MSLSPLQSWGLLGGDMGGFLRPNEIRVHELTLDVGFYEAVEWTEQPFNNPGRSLNCELGQRAGSLCGLTKDDRMFDTIERSFSSLVS